MIKKNIMALVLVISSFAAFGNETTMVISSEPTRLIAGTGNALFQYKIRDFMALTGSAFFGTKWPSIYLAEYAGAIAGGAYNSSLLMGGAGIGTRFFLNSQGFSDGFFAEPILILSMHSYNLKTGSTSLIDSNRITLLPQVLIGYSWFWDNGFSLSAHLETGYGYHIKNSITVDSALESRLADKSMLRNMLWADKGPWQFDYGYSVSLGYAFN